MVGYGATSGLWATGLILLMALLPLAYGQNLNCDFEVDICGMWQDTTDQYDWDRRNGDTPTVGTGPRNASSGLWYVYFETSDPRQMGEKARLGTQELNFVGTMCVEFAYNMYGQDMGSLQIFMIRGTDLGTRASPIWEVSGNHSINWKYFRQSLTVQDYNNRLVWEATKGTDYRSDIAIDNIRISRQSCSGGGGGGGGGGNNGVNLPFTCSFESPAMCGFTQGGGNFDWTRLDTATSSSQTGPSSAYRGIWYMYTEASPRQENDFAILQSPRIQYRGQVCLTFAYHMYGRDMGSLLVYTQNAGLNNPQWQRSGDQRNQWNTAQVTMDIQDDMILFRGVRGRDITSDVSIDDVNIRTGSCTGAPAPTTTTTTTTTTPRPSQITTGKTVTTTTGTKATGPTTDTTTISNPTETTTIVGLPGTTSSPGNLPFICDFEVDLCRMRQSPVSDQFDWLRFTGKAPTEFTGPSNAQKGRYYMYAEGSAPRRQNDITVIETPSFSYRGNICVDFYYHMYGENMGRLRVYSSFRGAGSAFFTESGNKNDQWVNRRITTFIENGETIRFEATMGAGIRSDIAVDNIQIRTGTCSGGPTPGPAPVTPPSITDLFTCDMEGDGSGNNQCRLRQDRTDNMDWVWRSARTPTSIDQNRRWQNSLYPVTGPERAQQGTYYLYIEASGRRNGDMARVILEGSEFRRGGTNCLRFWASMNGHHIGSLRVYSRRSGQRKYIWNFNGDQGPNWFRAAVDVNLDGVDQVGIEGQVKGEFSGDIAIDALSMSSGTCQPPPFGYIWACSFEMSDGAATMCSMEQDTTDTANFDWILWKDKTPSDETGPNRAFNGMYYIYTEASSPRQQGQRSRIYLPRLSRSGQMCVEFYYNMFGHHMGKLEVVTRVGTSSNPTSRWSLSGDRNNNWQQNRTTIENLRSDEQIGFQSTVGDAFSSDIALDNVRVKTGRC